MADQTYDPRLETLLRDVLASRGRRAPVDHTAGPDPGRVGAPVAGQARPPSPVELRPARLPVAWDCPCRWSPWSWSQWPVAAFAERRAGSLPLPPHCPRRPTTGPEWPLTPGRTHRGSRHSPRAQMGCSPSWMSRMVRPSSLPRRTASAGRRCRAMRIRPIGRMARAGRWRAATADFCCRTATSGSQRMVSIGSCSPAGPTTQTLAMARCRRWPPGARGTSPSETATAPGTRRMGRSGRWPRCRSRRPILRESRVRSA